MRTSLVLGVLLESGAIFSVRFEEFGKALQCSLTVVVDHFVITLLEQFDGGEALDLDVLQLVGGRVHLGDHDVGVVGVLLAQLVPRGSELFAVACKMF